MPERTYKLNADVIHQLREKAGLSVEGLAEKAGVHYKTLKKWLDGKPAFIRNVKALAVALKTETDSLLEGKRGTTDITEQQSDNEMSLHSNIAEFPANIPTEILDYFKAFAGPNSTVYIIAIKHGATATGVLCLLCALSGIAPIDARPFYITGLVLGVAGVAMAYKRRAGYIWPVMGLTANIVALVMWPNVIGMFPKGNGYEVRYDTRTVDAKKNYEEEFCTAYLGITPKPLMNERMEITVENYYSMKSIWNGIVIKVPFRRSPEYQTISIKLGDDQLTQRVHVQPDGKGIHARFPVMAKFGKRSIDYSQTNVQIYVDTHAVRPSHVQTLEVYIDNKRYEYDPMVEFFAPNGTDSRSRNSKEFLITVKPGSHTLTVVANGKEVHKSQFVAYRIGGNTIEAYNLINCKISD